ncbi:hypothetical protein GQ457_09G018950 [Hibiscus cannabinus]
MKGMFDQLNYSDCHKALSCSDEHTLECVVALLADEELSWWEATIFTALQRKLRGSSSLRSFNKKYISEQYLNDRRNRFCILNATSPLNNTWLNFVSKYCKYGAEYIKTERISAGS